MCDTDRRTCMLVTIGGLNTLRADHCHVKNKEVTVRQLLKYTRIPKSGGDSGLMLSSLHEFEVETANNSGQRDPSRFLKLAHPVIVIILSGLSMLHPGIFSIPSHVFILL